MKPSIKLSTCYYLHHESDVSSVTAFVDMVANAYILGGGARSDLSVSLDGGACDNDGLRLELSYITDNTCEKGGLREGEYLYAAMISPVRKLAFKELTSFLRLKKLSWYLMPGNAVGWDEHIDFDVPLRARLQFSKFGYEEDCDA